MKNTFFLILFVIFGGCSTVAGVGKDVTGAAEWSKEKISKQIKNK
jgi:predicted small secreted protein